MLNRKALRPTEEVEADDNPRATIGGNEPPDLPERTLPEILVEETVQLRARAADLVEQVGKANPKDEENCVLLAGMIRDFLREVDTARKERKEPFLTASRAVDAHFNSLAGLLAAAQTRIVGIVDENRRRREEAAAAERRRLQAEAEAQRRKAEEEARKRAEAESVAQRKIAEAERLRREAEERAAAAKDAESRQRARAEAAEAARARDLEAQRAAQEQRVQEQAERQATASAEALDRQAEQTTAAPTRSVYGVTASARVTYKATITDLTAAIRHARRIDGAAVEACIQQIYDRQVRAGVRTLPGATVDPVTTTTIRT
jgi:hypothetical protein